MKLIRQLLEVKPKPSDKKPRSAWEDQKEPEPKPDAAQVELIAALLTVGNLPFPGFDGDLTVHEGKLTVKLQAHGFRAGRVEIIDLTRPERYDREARSLVHALQNLVVDVDDQVNVVKEEHEDWVKQVKRMTWETIIKNWKDLGPVIDAMRRYAKRLEVK